MGWREREGFDIVGGRLSCEEGEDWGSIDGVVGFSIGDFNWRWKGKAGDCNGKLGELAEERRGEESVNFPGKEKEKGKRK